MVQNKDGHNYKLKIESKLWLNRHGVRVVCPYYLKLGKWYNEEIKQKKKILETNDWHFKMIKFFYSHYPKN